MLSRNNLALYHFVGLLHVPVGCMGCAKSIYATNMATVPLTWLTPEGMLAAQQPPNVQTNYCDGD